MKTNDISKLKFDVKLFLGRVEVALIQYKNLYAVLGNILHLICIVGVSHKICL